MSGQQKRDGGRVLTAFHLVKCSDRSSHKRGWTRTFIVTGKDNRVEGPPETLENEETNDKFSLNTAPVRPVLQVRGGYRRNRLLLLYECV